MKIGIVGSGTMGAVIAQVCAMAGHPVLLFDLNPEALEKAMASIHKNLDKGISIGKLDEAKKQETLNNLKTTDHLI